MTYSIGDTVVHPHHGAAVVESRQQRELGGTVRDYLVLQLTCGDLTLMVPADACEDVGIREIVDSRQVEQVLEILRSPEERASRNWSRRFKANQEKLRSGDIFKIAEVVRNLATRQYAGGVSAGERRMLAKAKELLLSELCVAMGTDEQGAENELTRILVEDHGLDVDEGAAVSA